MIEHKASRTLVKSPPELWAELSDEVSLAGHLAEPFGEIRITRLEPETAVAWEGERASGTVRIEPSGWGTRVTLTARAAQAESPARQAQSDPPADHEADLAPVPDPDPAPLPAPDPDPEPPSAPDPEPLPPAAVDPGPAPTSEAPPRGLRGRLLGWLRTKPAAPPAPAPPVPALAERVATKSTPPRPAVPKAPAAPGPARATSEAPEPESIAALDPDAVLVGILDSLGAAHHRPFSRG